MNKPQQTHQKREANQDSVLELRDVSVSFEMDRGDSQVLRNVNLDIYRDEVLGIVGESGSGKSMLASALLNAVVEPGQVSGEAIYHPKNGESVDILNMSKKELRSFRWEEVAMVFQGAMSSFNPTMEISDHFRETLQAHDYNMTEGMERAADLIKDLHMDPDRVLDSYPHELSGGMRQRALIGLSLVLEPNVLVMDEPTAALDLLMQRSILSLLSSVKKKYDLTMVFITHDLPLLTKLADRLAVLYAFELAEIGPTTELLANAGHPYTRALLNSTPNLDAPLQEMRAIEGSPPDPVDIPDGCSYHPRCPLADEICIESDPDFQEMSSQHEVTCHHWEEAEDAVPLTTEEDST